MQLGVSQSIAESLLRCCLILLTGCFVLFWKSKSCLDGFCCLPDNSSQRQAKRRCFFAAFLKQANVCKEMVLSWKERRKREMVRRLEFEKLGETEAVENYIVTPFGFSLWNILLISFKCIRDIDSTMFWKLMLQ